MKFKDLYLTICEKFNNTDYKYYVIVDGKIESGWEYREDAKDQLENLPPKKTGKVVAKVSLKKLGLDADTDSDWSTGIKEAKSGNYETYHKTYSSAVQAARKMAKEKGFTIDDDDWFTYVNSGPGKPDIGKTTRHTIPLYKDGEKTKKGLAIQVYGMESGKYELNAYIN